MADIRGGAYFRRYDFNLQLSSCSLNLLPLRTRFWVSHVIQQSDTCGSGNKFTRNFKLLRRQLPLPHTAIIPRNRQRIVQEIRGLVEKEWLPPALLVGKVVFAAAQRAAFHHFTITWLAATLSGTFVNFFLNKYWTFRHLN